MALVLNARWWGGLLVISIVLLLLDYAQDLMRAALEAGSNYQRFLTSGFRPDIPRHVAVVVIRSGIEPMEVTLLNVCEQRRFLSRVLEVVGRSRPSAVVIDKYFLPDTCPETDGTAALKAAVANLLEAKVPVVVGRKQVEETGDGGSLEPALELVDSRSSRSPLEGDLTLAEDVRQVVFEWQGVQSPDGSKRPFRTLAFQAALARTPGLLDANHRLNLFHARRERPFAGFLPLSELDRYSFSALQLLCGGSANGRTDWRTCSNPNEDVIGRLAGRVVLIGENTFGFDQHQTPVGTIPGVAIQASYVEAILDDNLFRVFRFWTFVFNFAVFVLIQMVILSALGVRGKFLILAAIVLGAYGVCYLVVNQWGLYLNPGAGLVVAVLTWLGDGVVAKLRVPL